MEGKTAYMVFTKKSGKIIYIKQKNILYIEEMDSDYPDLSWFKIGLFTNCEPKVLSFKCMKKTTKDLLNSVVYF